MKGKIIPGLIICCVLLACTEKPGNKITERLAIGPATPVSKIGLQADIRNFKIKTQDSFARNDSVLTNFKCRLEAERKETNPYYKSRIAELEKKSTELQKRIREYRTDKRNEWMEFKKEFSVELADLGKAHYDLRISNTHPEIVCK